MMRATLFSLVTLAITSTALATESGPLFWEFQNTSFRTAGFTGVSTAVALRDQTWPVVSYFDESRSSMDVASLFPVLNFQTQSVNPAANYWHRIGDNVMSTPNNQSYTRMTSSYGESEFNFSVKGVSYASPIFGGTITGTSMGWRAPEYCVIDTDYDSEGNLAKLTNSTVTGTANNSYSWTAISASTPGNVGVIKEYNGQLEYFQTNPYLSGWSMGLLQMFNNVIPSSSDLAMDSTGVPHIVCTETGNLLTVTDFDVISGSWKKTTLESGSTSQYPPIATLADTEDGLVGAAWVCDGNLKYAYKEGRDPWVITTVLGNGNYPEAPFPSQIPGLTYDTEGLPIISYVNHDRYVSIAYDPIMVPEPSTILLLLTTGIAAFAFYRKRR